MSVFGQIVILRKFQDIKSINQISAELSTSHKHCHSLLVLLYIALHCHSLPCVALQVGASYIHCLKLPHLAIHCLASGCILHTLPYIAMHWYMLPYKRCIFHTLPYIALHCDTLPCKCLHLTYIALHCHTLPYVALQGALCCNMLPYVALHCHILPYIEFHCLTLPYAALQVGASNIKAAGVLKLKRTCTKHSNQFWTSPMNYCFKVIFVNTLITPKLGAYPTKYVIQRFKPFPESFQGRVKRAQIA